MAEITIPLTVKVDDEQMVRTLEKALENHPDFTMVVRCKDCVRWNAHKRECGTWYGFYENDYCSYGERREENA